MLPVDELKAIKVRVTECLHLASAHFGKTFPEIPVKFDLTGKVGGYYCYHRSRATGKITQYFRFNRVLVRENLNEYLDWVIALHLTTHLHCTCPLICIRLYQSFASNLTSTLGGPDWQKSTHTGRS